MRSGERIFKNSFNRRIKVFDILVVGIMSYGVEIWGLKEISKLKKVKKEYLQ